MKQLIAVMAASMVVLGAAAQQTKVTSTSVNLAVPDDDANGLVSTQAVSGLSDVIQNVTVTLNFSGGYNGDLYAYLLSPNDTMVVLLNRVGGGNYGNPGFDITLNDTGGHPGIQSYQSSSPSYNGNGQLTGTWATSSGGLTSLAGLGGNGIWSLFVADLSTGNTSTLVSWGLTVSTVPEPQTWALLGGGGLMLVSLLRRKR
jgi:subtilisin-like proprotein convertase family protein